MILYVTDRSIEEYLGQECLHALKEIAIKVIQLSISYIYIFFGFLL